MKTLTEKLEEKEELAFALFPSVPIEIIPSYEEDSSLNEVLRYIGNRLKMERDNHLLGISGRLKRFLKGKLYNSYDYPCGSGILNPSRYAMDAFLSITGTKRKFSKEKALGILPTDEMSEICKKSLNDLIDKYDGDIYGSRIIPTLDKIYEQIKMRGDEYYWRNSKETTYEIQERHKLLKENIKQIWNTYRKKHLPVTLP